MRALFLQHDPGARPGLLGASLTRRGYEIVALEMATSISDATWHAAFPDVDGFDLIVPLGAIWSVHDTATVGSWIERELALLREADERGIPVLGVCFGGQALAAAHGGAVRRASRPEIGLTMLETDVPETIPAGPWMQWHHDVFEVPPGGHELARTAAGPQAFVLRRNLGLQFHPEVDRAAVAGWLSLGGRSAEDDVRRWSGVEPENLLRSLDGDLDRRVRDLDALVDAFLDKVAVVPG